MYLRYQGELIMKLSDKDLKKIIEYFKDKPVKKVYLFGSFARDEADDESDIDLLVDLDYSIHIGMNFIQMQMDLNEYLNKKIDLISTNGISKYLKPYIDHDKHLIYER